MKKTESKIKGTTYNELLNNLTMRERFINDIKTRFSLIFVAILTILILVTTSSSSCSKKNNCPNMEKGEIKDLKGLDGCGWVIEMKDGTTLEPTNLKSFDIDLIDGKKVWVSYHNSEKFSVSICMVGDIVDIDCIQKR